MAPWFPSVATKPAGAAKAEWTEAAKTGARIDPTYWDRVAPRTSLIAAAAVKAADLQGAAKAEAYLSQARRAVFERGEDPTSHEVLLSIAANLHLKVDLFRGDLGVGRYTTDDVVAALEPGRTTSENVSWFGRRTMLRAWSALADDIGNAEKRGLASPSLHMVHGKKESIVRGFATGRQVEDALKSVR